jgi:hypothetical protein
VKFSLIPGPGFSFFFFLFQFCNIETLAFSFPKVIAKLVTFSLEMENFPQKLFSKEKEKKENDFFGNIQVYIYIYMEWILNAPLLDVGLLTVIGVSSEAIGQTAHSQAISCSPTPR